MPRVSMRTRDDEDDHNDHDDDGDGDVPHASRYANFIASVSCPPLYAPSSMIRSRFVANLMPSRVGENSVQGFRREPTCRDKSITTRFGQDEWIMFDARFPLERSRKHKRRRNEPAGTDNALSNQRHNVDCRRLISRDSLMLLDYYS